MSLELIWKGERTMRCMFDELASKEVVNMNDGRRLGSIVDMELELTEGRVLNVIVPGPSRMMGLVRGDRDFSIPWERIVKIGDDVVLIDMDSTGFEG